MTSSRPYLIRALYDWIIDNEMTPYLLVSVNTDGVDVPKEYVREGRIILNISPKATECFSFNNPPAELVEVPAAAMFPSWRNLGCRRRSGRSSRHRYLPRTVGDSGPPVLLR
jgi:hypothetical protein